MASFPTSTPSLQVLGAHLEVTPECPSTMLGPPVPSALPVCGVQMIFFLKEPRETFSARCYLRALGNEVTFTKRHSKEDLYLSGQS